VRRRALPSEHGGADLGSAAWRVREAGASWGGARLTLCRGARRAPRPHLGLRRPCRRGGCYQRIRRRRGRGRGRVRSRRLWHGCARAKRPGRHGREGCSARCDGARLPRRRRVLHRAAAKVLQNPKAEEAMLDASSGDAPRTAPRRAPARCCSASCRAARPSPLPPSTCCPKPRQRGGRGRRPAAVAPGPTRAQAFNGRSALQRFTAGASTSPSRSRTSPWTRVTPRERPDLIPCTPDALLSRAFHDPPSAPIPNLIFLSKTALKIYDPSVGFL
jgi:hypothetical protein